MAWPAATRRAAACACAVLLLGACGGGGVSASGGRPDAVAPRHDSGRIARRGSWTAGVQGSKRRPAGVSSADAPTGRGAGGARPQTIAAALAQVARARQLAVLRPVVGKRLNREQVIALIRAKVERDIPVAALDAQGEVLRALGLIGPRYDFVGGIYGLVQQNVAGLYDDDTERMVLLDDLSPLVEKQTLAHELVHALQHQHYDLNKLLRYHPGHSDRITAGHALAEGDATSAMLDITAGSAFVFSPRALRLMMVSSVALSGDGAQVPRVLQLSLVVPYVDGFAFVQALRRRGGWSEVDRAWRRLPLSTEQLLHLDKYDANERPLPVSEPPLPAGVGWNRLDADELGEQGLRLVLAQWSPNAVAEQAAAGWGGDRYLVAVRTGAQGAEVAVAWHLRFDSLAEAREAAKVLSHQLGPGCRPRADLGPIVWLGLRADLVLVAGPYRRTRDGAPSATGRCNEAVRWAMTVLAQR